MSSRAPLEPASVRFLDGGIPFSEIFQDIYFSPEGGLAETRYVFLDGNRLPSRFAGRSRFVVGELGFGTGLNFLATLRAWREARRAGDVPADAELVFISCEKHPLRLEDLSRALEFFPELGEESRALLSRYPTLIAGHHALLFPECGARLILFLGDIEDHLVHFPVAAGVDAWFLDGFAPDPNPAMWGERVALRLAELSARNATLATFSVAGGVKRPLAAAGFVLEKRKGFGRKREMLVGGLDSATHAPTQSGTGGAIQIEEWVLGGRSLAPDSRVAVIGGGLAGMIIAGELAGRGHRVNLFERRPTLASEASGNPAGIFMPYLSAGESETSTYALTSLGFLRRHWDPAWEGRVSGIVRLVGEEGASIMERALARMGNHALEGWVTPLSSDQVRERCGFTPRSQAFEMTEAGYVRAGSIGERALARAAEQGHPVQVQAGAAVEKVERGSEGWSLSLSNGERVSEFDAVVIANANDAARLAPTAFLPLTPLRGQIAEVPNDAFVGGGLRVPVSQEFYLCPTAAGFASLGATFDLKDGETTLRPEANQGLFADLLAECAEGAADIDASKFDPSRGRVAFRCTTADKLPVIGAVPDVESYEEAFGRRMRGKLRDHEKAGEPRVLDGLWVFTGFGSRGITYIPYGAHLLGSLMSGDVVSTSLEQLSKLHPARFVMRKLRRPN